MSFACIIPVKGKEMKSRLSKLLKSERRETLSVQMFMHVALCASKVFGSENVFVVTPSQKYILLASSLGIKSIKEPEQCGVNGAVNLALERVDASTYFILPSDLPLLTANELSRAKALSREFDVLLAPSYSFDGTNLLTFRKNSKVKLSYDKNSFWNHLRSAARRRMRITVLSSLGIINDLDTLEDIRRIATGRLNIGMAEKIREVWMEIRQQY